MDHAQVGGELARKWELPSCLKEAITHHHRPTFANESPELAAIVHLANTICLRMGIGLPNSIFLPSPDSEALRILPLEPYEFDMLANHFGEMLKNSLVTDQDLMPATSFLIGDN
jgi:HD-like signal output (HDOD) protein